MSPMQFGAHQERTKAIKRPDTFMIYWAAGFFEGEGSAVASKNTRTDRCSILMRINQKDPTSLVMLRDYFGGNVVRDGSRPMWIWSLTGVHGRGFAMTIYKLLTPRRKEQIRRALFLDGQPIFTATMYERVKHLG